MKVWYQCEKCKLIKLESEMNKLYSDTDWVRGSLSYGQVGIGSNYYPPSYLCGSCLRIKYYSRIIHKEDN